MSKEPFSWASPNIQGLTKFLKWKLRWEQDLIDRTLKDVMTSMKNNNPQTRIEKFFKVRRSDQITTISSERIAAVLREQNGNKKIKRTSDVETK